MLYTNLMFYELLNGCETWMNKVDAAVKELNFEMNRVDATYSFPQQKITEDMHQLFEQGKKIIRHLETLAQLAPHQDAREYSKVRAPEMRAKYCNLLLMLEFLFKVTQEEAVMYRITLRTLEHLHWSEEKGVSWNK